MSYKYDLFTEHEAIGILEKEGCPSRIIKHSIMVSKVCTLIASALKEKGIKIDIKLVKIGGLLHDIGRSRTHSVYHGYIGGKILRENGIDSRIIKIAQRHVGGGIANEEAEKLNFPKDCYIPETLEEKVVCFGDKIAGLNTIIPLNKTLDQLKEELGEQNGTISRIIELRNEIASLLGADPEQIIRKSLQA